MNVKNQVLCWSLNYHHLLRSANENGCHILQRVITISTKTNTIKNATANEVQKPYLAIDEVQNNCGQFHEKNR